METYTRIKQRSMIESDDRDLIAVHTMEAPEGPQTAENVAIYFDRVNADAHWCVDNNSRTRVIPDNFIAWTLPGANTRSLNIEIAGYARQTALDWEDSYSVEALEIAAICAAEWVIKYIIPIRKLTDTQILAGEKGFVGHVDVNRVYKKSSHWDPGPAFPWPYFLDRVRVNVALIRGQVAPPNTSPMPTPNWNNHGYSTEYIKARQEQLNKVGPYNLVVDGKLGDVSKTATRDFQGKHGLAVDGVPGPMTAAKLTEVLRPVAKPNCTPLQAAVRTDRDNAWGGVTDKHCDAVREASNWGGNDFPWGKAFTQAVVGAKTDGVWGPMSAAAHTQTVKAVQEALKIMGFNPGPIDGFWGDVTETAYQAARKACHI